MANADIRQLEMDGKVFYPQTDIHGLVNNGGFAIDDEPTQGSSNLVTSDSVYRIKSETLQENREMVDSVMLDYAPVEIHGDVNNAADEEDLTSVNIEGTDVLKFKDKIYNQLVYSGMGKKILRKNMINGVNTLTQSMINDENTIYVIQYDYVLGKDITIPANCVLQFEGGSFHGDGVKKIIFNKTEIIAAPYRIFYNMVYFNNWNEPDSINLVKNEESLFSWFATPGEDCTDEINRALSIFRKLKLSDNTTYVVNSTINLSSYKSIIFGASSTLLKTQNPESPVIYIKGSYNSINSLSKSSGIKSEVATPYGLIAVAEYGETISNGMTTYNKIDGIKLEGVESTDANTLSVGLYGKGTYINVGRYYNSFTNLYFVHFNIGIYILGDFNANFFRDFVFTYVGHEYTNHSVDKTKEAAIVFESLFTTNTSWGATLENSISQIFHTGSTNATTILFKGSVQYNILQAINSEVGGQQANTFKAIKKESEITHKLLGSIHNTIIMAGVNYQGSAFYEGFFDENIVIDSAAYEIYTPRLVTNECTVDTVAIKKNTFINNFYVEKLVTYQVPNYKTFDICKIVLNNLGDSCLLNIKIIDLAAHSYVSSREFRISINRDGNGPIIKFIMNSDISDNEDNHYPVIMAKPKIDGSNIIIRGTSPNIVATYSHYYSICAECIVYNSYRASLFELFDTYTESDVQYQNVCINKIGGTSIRPTYPAKGDYYFDKDIQKLIFASSIASDGTITWVDATGTPV